MKVQFASDLHLEFPANTRYLKNNPIIPNGEILILAGDIILFLQQDKVNDFFEFVADNFEATYWIPGNHEYYYFDISAKPVPLNEKIKNNIFLVNDASIIHKEVKFIFSTLWSNISNANRYNIANSLNDFRIIKNGKRKLSPEYYNSLNKKSVEFLEKELSENNSKKTIVATHHVPTFLNYPEQYRNSPINEAFAIELFNLIENHGPDYWIYGHHHSNVPPFKIGKTTLLTNQLGYVDYGEHLLFNGGKIISI